MFIFVTGVAGSGKSTLCADLASRGVCAHDADDGVSRHVRIADGAEVQAPPRSHQGPEWVARHEFRFDQDRVKELATQATPSTPVVLLGAAYGDDDVISIADQSWYLDLDEGELRRRLAARAPGSYGQAPHELEAILAWNAAAASRYESLGATRLDATRPARALGDEILAAAAAGNSHRR